jgi:Uma2 family endonuclease
MLPGPATIAPMTRRPATYQDVLDAPEGKTAELVDGELFLMSRGRSRHAWAIGRLFADLGDAFGGEAGWWFLIEVELWLGHPDPQGRVLVPDLSGWRRDRYAPDPDATGHTVVPDWVAEVLSPTTARRDRLQKLGWYAEAGVGHVWLVDPEQRSIEVYALRDGAYALVGGAADDADVALAPFDGAVRVGRIWM